MCMLPMLPVSKLILPKLHDAVSKLMLIADADDATETDGVFEAESLVHLDLSSFLFFLSLEFLSLHLFLYLYIISFDLHMYINITLLYSILFYNSILIIL